jgi:hypothetical protein
MMADTVGIGRVLDIQLKVYKQTHTTDKSILRRIDNRQIGVRQGHVQIKYLVSQST